MRSQLHAIGITLVAGLMLATTPSFGQGAPDSSDPKARARELYKAGSAAVREGKPGDGLPMLEEAERLFHAPTHVLFIARAKAGLGKLLDARATYQKLADEKLPSDASDPFREAQATGVKELAALDARIPKVVVQIEPSGAKGLAVVMNGATFASDRLRTPLPVDPGTYVFEAKADGLEAPKVTVDAAERTTTEVRLVLKPSGSTRPDAEVSRGDVKGPAPAKRSGWSGVRIASIPLMGVGAGSLVAGSVLTALHFTTQTEADDLATCAPSCALADVDEIVSLDDRAATFGTVGIVGLAAGGGLLGLGIVLFAVGGSSPPPSSGEVRVRPVAGLGFIGVEGAY